jgi:signal transduction histidine kinase
MPYGRRLPDVPPVVHEEDLMLHEFITINRETIIARTREQVESRPWPSVSSRELEQGVPLFLTQLSETLRLEGTDAPFPDETIASTAARHGAELLSAGFNVSQVVHDYGDICQAITQLAVEQKAPITVGEFHTLNRCLDTAIAEAVTEHARITAQTGSTEEVERLGHSAHELRDSLNTALLAFHMLKHGTVAINGSTGEVLGRSLMGLRDLVDRTLSEVRLARGEQRRERLMVVTFLDEIAAAGMLHSEYRHIEFTVQPVDPSLAVEGDPQLLTSAVMNLLHNAFKSTPAGGHVVLRACPKAQRLVIEIEDQCGGIPEGKGDLFQADGDNGGAPSGIGHGLSIARKAMRAHGGDIHVRNMPGKGCVFALDMPLAVDAVPVA